MGNSKDEVILYMKLQADLRKLVDSWQFHADSCGSEEEAKGIEMVLSEVRELLKEDE